MYMGVQNQGIQGSYFGTPHTLLFLHLVILVTSLDLFASIVDVITRDPFIYFFIFRLFICCFFFLLLCIKSGNKTALNLPYP